MRKFLFLLAFILPIACSFVACSSDDEPTKTELTSAEIEKLQGTWKITKVEDFQLPGERKIVFDQSSVKVYMKNPTAQYFRLVDEYTYKVVGNMLTLTNKWSGEVGSTVEVLSFSDTALKAVITDMEYGYGTYTAHMSKEQNIELASLQGTWNATDVSITNLPAMKFLIKGNQLIVFEKSTGLNFSETGTYSMEIVGQTLYLSIIGYSSTDMVIELSNISATSMTAKVVDIYNDGLTYTMKIVKEK